LSTKAFSLLAHGEKDSPIIELFKICFIPIGCIKRNKKYTLELFEKVASVDRSLILISILKSFQNSHLELKKSFSYMPEMEVSTFTNPIIGSLIIIGVS
jgi:hypothetical protein